MQDLLVHIINVHKLNIIPSTFYFWFVEIKIPNTGYILYLILSLGKKYSLQKA